MTTERFQQLCEGICDLVEAPRFAVPQPAQGPLAFHLDRRGVTVNVLYFAEDWPHDAIVIVEFGEPPKDDPRIGRIALALLEANFLLPGLHPPSLARNPATGDIVLRWVYPLADATAGALMTMIDAGVDLALEWRETRFIADSADGQAGAPGGSAFRPWA